MNNIESNRFKSENKKIIAVWIVLGVVFLAILWFYAHAFLGNPISKFLAVKNAEELLESGKYGEGYEVSEAGYWFKDGYYHIKAEKPESPDSAFTMYFDMRGNCYSDDFEGSVIQKGNICNRLLDEYRHLIESVSTAKEKLDTDIIYGYIAFDDDAEFFELSSEGKVQPVKKSNLNANQVFDLERIGSEAGVIHVSIYSSDFSPEHFADTLVQIKDIFDKAGVRFTLVTLSITDNEHAEDGTPFPTAELVNFPYDDIHKDGLAERIEKTITSTSLNEEVKEITTITSSVSDTSQSKEKRILVGHNGKTVYVSEAESETIKAVIANHQLTAAMVFYGSKDYTIYIEENPFGVTDEIFYDMSKGLLGNSSIVELHGKEKEMLDGVLARVLPDVPQTTLFNPPETAKWGVFRVKEVNGTVLILTDRSGDESKLYSCDFGDLESAAEKNFRAGSLLSICYESGQMVDGFIHISPYQIEFTDEM
jgi:hypothetical protein